MTKMNMNDVTRQEALAMMKEMKQKPREWKDRTIHRSRGFFVAVIDFNTTLLGAGNLIKASSPLLLEKCHTGGVILATATDKQVYLWGIYGKAMRLLESGVIRLMTYEEFFKLMPHYTKFIFRNEVRFVAIDIRNNYFHGLVSSERSSYPTP